jgi:S1-C subfamily serine protease
MIKNNVYFIILLNILHCFILLANESPVVDPTWQDIQCITRDAVVQIFATSRETNWLNPYVVCGTKMPSGTGFFINDQGYIATCAHLVHQAIAVHIALPALGKQRFKATVIGLCPQHDIALLQLDEKAFHVIRNAMGEIPYLKMGDSDIIQRGETILSLGYPGTTIEVDQLKGNIGVISARLNRLFQFDVPVNPGNSGGPLLNKHGEVIAITVAQMQTAQNSNFGTPINIFKALMPALHNHRLLRIDDHGIVWIYTNEETRKYFNCPKNGCLVVDILESSPAALAGLKINDIIYQIDHYLVDNYGEIEALCDDERMRFDSYINQLPVETNVSLGIYREGKPLDLIITTTCKNKDGIIFKYPAYEKIDYEIFAGMIIMPLTLNYIYACVKERPSLQRYASFLYSNEPRLVIANIFSDSKLFHMQTIKWGDTINEINGETVRTLDDFRNALTKSLDNGLVVIKTTDEITLETNNVFTVLSLPDSCRETIDLSYIHQYSLSETTKNLLHRLTEL